MEKMLQMAMYFSWALWLLYYYVLLFNKKPKPDRKLLGVTLIGLILLMVLLRSRMMLLVSIIALLVMVTLLIRRRKKEKTPAPPQMEEESPFFSFVGMALTTVVMVTLAFLLSMDFKSEANYFIKKYTYYPVSGQTNPVSGSTLNPMSGQTISQQKEIIIGNSKTDSQLTLENRSADKAHLKLVLEEKTFQVQNISRRKKVDINGSYLNNLLLEEGDEIEINGKERIRIIKIGKQNPLGRSINLAVHRKGKKEPVHITVHTLLNKPVIIRYKPVKKVSTGLNELFLPAPVTKSLAVLSYQTKRTLLGLNIYYIIVFLAIFFLCAGIYLYLRNRFNGALLLYMIAFLPFMAGVVSVTMQAVITIFFIPCILYVRKRRSQFNWGSILLVFLFGLLFVMPSVLRMDGDFTFRYYDFSKRDAVKVTRQGKNFQLTEIGKELAYNTPHQIILGHTRYRLTVTPKDITLVPLSPEKIRLSPGYKAIISNLEQVEPENDYTYLKFPHQFEALPAAEVTAREELTIEDESGNGNSITLTKIIDKNYSLFFNGLFYLIIIPFWLFWLIDHFGIPLGKKHLFRLRLFNHYSSIIFNFVYFMLGLGYVVFGALALYNNNYLKNFEKYRSQALPLFILLFFIFLLLSRYNRWLVFLYRTAVQKKFHVPFITGIILLLPVNYNKIFLYISILFFIFVFGFRLRKDLYYEFKRTASIPINLKKIIEKPIAGFEEKANQRIFFGLGRVLDSKGWNYLLISDLLLLLALFFIVLQVFLGGELGVSVAGFVFLPIEMGKILLTIYFADWVSRIDKGMGLNVLWVYGLVMIPFALLVVFLKDFSPMLVFAFVFLYHIIKIKKPWQFKLGLLSLIFFTLIFTVTALANFSFPYIYFSIGVSILLLVALLRVWFRHRGAAPPGKNQGILRKLKKPLISLVIILLLVSINYVAFFKAPSAPKTLGTRINSWLSPWQDYNLSYQYVNSLWLMKGTGTFGKSSEALQAAAYVPLIEKDLSFSLYISTLGTLGLAFIFLTLFLVAAFVYKLGSLFGSADIRSPNRWGIYMLEFLSVIFLAQYLVPALYVVGLLPIMGQPLPFLSYSNNILLLFALPFSFLMILLANNLTTALPEGISGFQGEPPLGPRRAAGGNNEKQL